MKQDKLFAKVESPRLNDLLDDWRWLITDEVSLVSVTAMGDLILENSNGAICFLDTIEGKYEQITEGDGGYQELLKQSEFRQKYLRYYCVLNLVEEGVELDTGQCYSPDVPLHLGGELDEDNLKPTDIYVHFSMSGQIWRQTQDLKPGAKIDTVEVITPKRGFLARVRDLLKS